MALLVCDTAMHCELLVKLALKANCDRIHRCAMRSYWTMGSPRLVVRHRLAAGRLAQIVLPFRKPGEGNCGTPVLL